MIERIECGEIMSRAVVHAGLIYFSGHVASGKQPSMKEQAEALFKRYDELLGKYGSDKEHLLSATIYVTDMGLKPEFNEAWKSWIPPRCAPARVCIECKLEPGYLVEMTIVAEIIG
jgi:enamine deaminase RidA (YjgF/YER057c/UK114 family)